MSQGYITGAVFESPVPFDTTVFKSAIMFSLFNISQELRKRNQEMDGKKLENRYNFDKLSPRSLLPSSYIFDN